MFEQGGDLEQVTADERNALVEERLESAARGLAGWPAGREPPQRSHESAAGPIGEQARAPGIMVEGPHAGAFRSASVRGRSRNYAVAALDRGVAAFPDTAA